MVNDTVNNPEQEALLDLIVQSIEKQELGDATVLQAIFEGKYIYDKSYTTNGWHWFNGTIWKKLDLRVLRPRVMEQMRELYDATAQRQRATAKGVAAKGDAGSKEESEALTKQAEAIALRAGKLCTVSHVDKVIELTSGLDGMHTDGTKWDADPWLLACEDGVIDLRKDAAERFRAGRPQDLLRSCAPTKWKGLNQPAPRFEQFMQELFDGRPEQQELVDFLHRFFGYGITGISNEKALPIFYGDQGDNGKSTLLNALKSVLGHQYAAPVGKGIIVRADRHRDGEAPQPGLYAMMGRRLAWVSETDEGDMIDAGTVKMLTGADPITCRTLHQRPVTFDPTHKIMLITNHKPRADAGDQALWNRVMLVPFELSFKQKPDPSNPNHRQGDKNLGEHLKHEASGILAWLVRGCLAWQEVGLQPPQVITMATEAYRDAEDMLGRFLSEQCVQTPKAKVTATKLFQEYEGWAKENGFRKPLSKPSLEKQIERKGFVYYYPQNKKTFKGLGLRSEYGDPELPAPALNRALQAWNSDNIYEVNQVAREYGVDYSTVVEQVKSAA